MRRPAQLAAGAAGAHPDARHPCRAAAAPGATADDRPIREVSTQASDTLTFETHHPSGSFGFQPRSGSFDVRLPGFVWYALALGFVGSAALSSFAPCERSADHCPCDFGRD